VIRSDHLEGSKRSKAFGTEASSVTSCCETLSTCSFAVDQLPQLLELKLCREGKRAATLVPLVVTTSATSAKQRLEPGKGSLATKRKIVKASKDAAKREPSNAQLFAFKRWHTLCNRYTVNLRRSVCSG
jgi:hypothetical protein